MKIPAIGLSDPAVLNKAVMDLMDESAAAETVTTSHDILEEETTKGPDCAKTAARLAA